MALAFAFTNGVHDAANAIATLVSTCAARPGAAVVLAAVGNVAGPLLLGTAVASTVAGIVTVQPDQVLPIVCAASAVAWNGLTWWRGLPSSSGHALLGGVVGAALAGEGLTAVDWGGFNGILLVGVLGVAAVLVITPIISFGLTFLVDRCTLVVVASHRPRARGPVRGGQWMMSQTLASMHVRTTPRRPSGLSCLVLVGKRRARPSQRDLPIWVELLCGAALTLGTATGGWRIVRTLGRRITLVRPLDALASETCSAGVLLASSLVGAPVSTSEIVASSVVGLGGGRRRWRHVRWPAAAR